MRRQMKFGIVFALVAVMGCASEESGTPGQRLLSVTRDANQEVSRLKANGTIFTSEMSVDIVAPVEAAAREVFDEMAAWQVSPPDQAYTGAESEWLRQASLEMKALMENLGTPVSSYSAAAAEPIDEECPTADEIAAELAEFGFGPPADPVDPVDPVTPADPATTPDSDGAKVPADYWLRYLCRAGCATAQVVCSAACAALIVPPLTALSPSIIACFAACTAAGAICQDACSGICNR